MTTTTAAELAKRKASRSVFLFNDATVGACRRLSSTACGEGAGKKLKSGARATSTTAKEKDRIGAREQVAALQLLVSPFGKRDTASVLQEASEYIRFLQDQIQVLLSPYLGRPIMEMVQDGAEYNGLRNRGLCLMPAASAFLMANNNGADLWAPIRASKKP